MFVISVLLTALVFAALYAAIAYPALRKRFREGREVKYMDANDRMREGRIAQTPGFGFGLSKKHTVSIATKKGQVVEIPFKRIRPK
jgi:hypothetical protein